MKKHIRITYNNKKYIAGSKFCAMYVQKPFTIPEMVIKCHQCITLQKE